MAITVGYKRRRSLISGRWEGPLTTAVLLLAGVILVSLVVLRVLGWLPF